MATNGPNWAPDMARGWTNCMVPNWNCIFANGVGFHDDGTVRTINLQEADLSGYLPESLSQLTDLETLVLYANNLAGPFPMVVTQLSSLLALGLSGNAFYGPIPSQISNLTNLLFLDLGYNNFSGPLPDSVFTLPKLQRLYLSNVPLFGTIPSQLANLTMLVEFYAAACGLGGTIPDIFDSLPRLVFFSVSANELTGELPPSLYRAANLQNIFISGNNLGGVISENISGLTGLITLEAYGNGFRGTIPRSVASLSQLTNLLLYNNMIEGVVPGELGNCSQLQYIAMHRNRLSAVESEVFLRDASFRFVDLSFNNLSTVPNSMFLQQMLFVVRLDGNHFADFPWSGLLTMPQLNLLGLSLNNISSDPFDAGILSTGLSVIDLSYNPGIRRNLYDSYLCTPGLGAVTLLDVSYTGIYIAETPQMVQEQERSICAVLSLYILDVSGTDASDSDSLAVIARSFRYLRELQVNGAMVTSPLDQLADLPGLSYVDIRNNPQFTSSMSALAASVFAQPSADTDYDVDRHFFCFNLESKAPYDVIFFVDIEVFSSYALCFCDRNFYGKPPYCTPCPKNADCPGPGMIRSRTTALKDPVARFQAFAEGGTIFAAQGFWASPPYSLSEIQNGRYPVAFQSCNGFGSEISRCRPSAEDKTQTCEEGYHERLCSRCAPTYFAISAEWSALTKCMTCDSRFSFGAFVFIVIMAILLLILVAFTSSSYSSGFLKILIFVLQTLAQLRLPSPPAVSSFQGSVFALASLTMFGPECYFSWWSYDASFSFALLTPALCVLGPVLVWSGGRIAAAFMKRSLDTTDISWNGRCIRAIIFMLYVCYIGTGLAVLTPLKCNHDSGLDEEFMTNVPYRLCNSWVRKTAFAFVVLFVIGVPVTMAVVVYLSFKSDRTVGFVGEEGYSRKVYGLLFATFVPNFQYWEILITIRRVALATVFLTLDYRSSFQGFLILSILFAALYMQVSFNPYLLQSENALEVCALVVVGINFVVSLQYESSDVTDVGALSVVLLLMNLAFFSSAIVLFLATTKIVRSVLKKTRFSLSRRRTRFVLWNTANIKDDAGGLEQMLMEDDQPGTEMDRLGSKNSFNEQT
jgi:Leucine-rich repeat (LRR) protein